ncbi:MAG: hypothetical protein IJN42_00670 [Clostridia bacterium]|nr:hypothetical protein [Clostridia bacterium]
MKIIVPQLIAALIALAGSVVNILDLFIPLPPWLSIISAVALILAVAVWLGIYLVNTKKAK